jgi:hypothetical protein
VPVAAGPGARPHESMFLLESGAVLDNGAPNHPTRSDSAIKRFWRDTPRRIGAFFQPLVYLLLLGTGLQAAFKVFGGGNVKYIRFMFPGILGMTVLFTSVFSAISILWDREFGFLKEILVSPGATL